MQVIQNICRKCILPEEYMGMNLNSDGECKFCADPDYKNINWARRIINSESRRQALKNWNEVVDLMKNNHCKVEYDCVLGYSGGKDSTALLDHLVNDLGLNPLCVTVDTGSMTRISKDNMEDTLKKIHVDHVLIEECIPTFTKLYHYLFTEHTSNTVFLSRDVCDRCSDLIHSICVKEAMKRYIPIVLFGYSPDQIFRYFYEMPRDDVIMEWKPEFLDYHPFTKDDLDWYLNDKEINSGKIPRVLLPYHVIPYREEDIINLVESKNYIKKGHADPLLTNCIVVHAAQFYDANRYGGILYAYQYAELVRQDPSVRRKWLMTLKHAFPLIIENQFKEQGVTEVLERIRVSQEELIKIINQQLAQDPNKDQIEMNKSAFKKRRRNRSNI